MHTLVYTPCEIVIFENVISVIIVVKSYFKNTISAYVALCVLCTVCNYHHSIHMHTLKKIENSKITFEKLKPTSLGSIMILVISIQHEGQINLGKDMPYSKY